MTLNQRISPSLSEIPCDQQVSACGQRGFTLIELMVVITILGILAGIASGAYLSIRDSYRAETATSQLRSILTSARLSAMSNANSVEVTIHYAAGAAAVRNSVTATHRGGVYDTVTEVVSGGATALEGVYVFKASTALPARCAKVVGDTLKTIRFSPRATVTDITNAGTPSILISSDAAGTKDMHCLQIRPVTGRVSVLKP